MREYSDVYVFCKTLKSTVMFSAREYSVSLCSGTVYIPFF